MSVSTTNYVAQGGYPTPTTTLKSLDLSDDELSVASPAQYQYDMRLEIGAKDTNVTVPVVAIFRNLVQRMKQVVDNNSAIVILTATDKLFFEEKEMSSKEFQKAFQVDSVDGRASKVLLGFKLRTTTKLSDIKRRLLHTYLIPHGLFLREHTGGFEHGVKSYAFGFLKDDHPDIQVQNKRFARLMADSWKKLDKTDRKTWRNELPNLFYGDSGITIPVNFTKERISASVDGKEKITTSGLMVSTPMKYGKLFKALLDKAIFSKAITNLIPFALNRENPEGYYFILAQQARFIDNHRNIPISNIPHDASTKVGEEGKQLMRVLYGNPAIRRVAYDPQQQKYHVSTTADKYREVHQWIAKTLEENKFPYNASIRPMKYGNTPGKSIYSTIFKDTLSVANDTYDESTIKTARSTAWKNRPPVAISYVPTADAFPPLPTKQKKPPATPSTTSETFDEDTIQSAITSALKKLEDQHRAELSQLKEEMQQKIEKLETQMRELGQQVATQTYQALVNEDSPLVTKTDHAHLQHQIGIMSTQLTTFINMFQTGNITPGHRQCTDDSTTGTHMEVTSPPRNTKRSKINLTPVKFNMPDEAYTQEHSFSSASSSPEEGMEGCEE